MINGSTSKLESIDPLFVENRKKIERAMKFCKTVPAMIRVCSTGDLEQLSQQLEKGLDLNQHTSTSTRRHSSSHAYAKEISALFISAALGHLPVVKKLLEKGAMIEHRTQLELDGLLTPLQAAMLTGQLQVVTYLVTQGASYPCTDWINENFTLESTQLALREAIQSGLKERNAELLSLKEQILLPPILNLIHLYEQNETPMDALEEDSETDEEFLNVSRLQRADKSPKSA